MGRRAKRTHRKKKGGMPRRLNPNASPFQPMNLNASAPPAHLLNQHSSSNSSDIPSLSSESSYGLDGPVVMPSTMRTDRNLRSETGPLGERQLPQEVIRHIGDRASGLYPELYEKQERAEAEKNHAVSKIIDFANRKYGPDGVALNDKYKRILEGESDSSDYEQTIMKREAERYFDKLEKEDDDIHKTLKLKERELEAIESDLAAAELVDFELCDNMFNNCYLNKDTLEECRRDGYEEKYLIPCKDRTQVYITTFTQRPNGLDEVKSMLTVLSDKEIDKMPVKEMADHFPGRIFTNASKKVFYAILIGMRLCPNFVKNGEQIRQLLPEPNRRARGFRGGEAGPGLGLIQDGDRVCDLYDYFNMNRDKLLEFLGIFETSIKERRIHANKGDQQDEYIEKMKRYILLRLMNRDPYVVDRLPYQLRNIVSELESIVESEQDDVNYAQGRLDMLLVAKSGSPKNMEAILKQIERDTKIVNEEQKRLNKSKEVLSKIEGLLEQGWHPKVYVSNVGPKQALLSRDEYYNIQRSSS